MGTTMHINSTASSDKVNMPLPGHVGQEFVRQYYTLLNKAPEFLYKFYGQSSTFIHGAIYKNGEQEEQCVGQENIRQKILSLDFADCRTKIRQVDACASLNTSVVVQVSGELSNRAAPLRRFMQTFVLCPQNGAPCKFYVQTDMFRYQDDVFQDEDSQSDSVEYVEQKEDSSKCVAGGDNQHSESVIDAAVHYQPKEDESVAAAVVAEEEAEVVEAEEAEEAVAFAEAAETSDAEEHLPVAVDAAVVEEEPAAATTTHSSSAATSESATPEKPVATPASTTSPVVSPPVEPVAKLATPVAPVVVEEPVAVVAPVVVVPQEPAKPVSWADMILKGTKSLTSLTYSPVVPQKVSAPPVSQAAVEPVTEAVEQQQQQQPQQQPQSTQHLPHQHQQRGGHRAHHHQRNNYQHNNNNHRNNNAGGGNYNNDGDFNQQQQRRSHNGPQ